MDGGVFIYITGQPGWMHTRWLSASQQTASYSMGGNSTPTYLSCYCCCCRLWWLRQGPLYWPIPIEGITHRRRQGNAQPAPMPPLPLPLTPPPLRALLTGGGRAILSQPPCPLSPSHSPLHHWGHYSQAEAGQCSASPHAPSPPPTPTHPSTNPPTPHHHPQTKEQGQRDNERM